MTSTAALIGEIIKQRKARLPLVEEILKRCTELHEPLQKTESILEELAKQSDGNVGFAEVCMACQDNTSQFRAKLVDLEKDIIVNKVRFGRETVNIGFAGTKGTGKSFLLQKISGLSDNEVPSGDGLPVTAVRCTIKNSSENKAYVSFYDENDFIQHRLTPFYRELGITPPVTLTEFRGMHLPDHYDNDREEILRQKLQAFQKNINHFAPYLRGHEEVIELAELRKFVAYSVENSSRPGGIESSYAYLAVAKVIISCPFPRSDVKALQLIDLPGLGELDPSLEYRHTEGFQNDVDVCLFVRRPSGTRMDWDQEAQKALEVLSENSPLSRASDFVILVLNAGGCKEDNTAIMHEETRSKLGNRYKILLTTSSDSQGLSSDVLALTLDHLSNKMPEFDAAIFSNLSERLARIREEIREFTETAKQLLKQRGQGQDLEEIVRRAACKAKARFAWLNGPVLIDLEKKALSDSELEGVIEQLDLIETQLDSYFKDGMNEGSMAAWHKNAAEEIANATAPEGVLINRVNHMRVQIALSFSMLDAVYKSRVEDLQLKAVNAFNDVEVLNGLINNASVEKNLQVLLDYIDNTEFAIPQMHEAVEQLLKLTVEHNTQFYPRAYEPIRLLKKAVRGVILDGQTPEDQAESLYRYLVDIGMRTVSEIKRLLIQETRQVFNILYVSYEFFDDALVRNENAEDEWIRFFKAYYDDLRPGARKTNKSYLLNKALKQIDALREAAI